MHILYSNIAVEDFLINIRNVARIFLKTDDANKTKNNLIPTITIFKRNLEHSYIRLFEKRKPRQCIVFFNSYLEKFKSLEKILKHLG